MSEAQPAPGLYAFLAEARIARPQLRQIKAGRNSRVWRVDSADGLYIAKEYHCHPGDHRDRLATEYAFLVFLHAQGISEVPRPLARQAGGNRALYSYLPGEPVRTIGEAHIEQAADFIERINRTARAEAAQELPPAAEACFSPREHLDRVGLRIRWLAEALSDTPDALHQQARSLVEGQLRPTFSRLAQQLNERFPPALMDRRLPQSQRILSPSDFGFHNMLESDGQLAFLDFEYAGWDDPAKLCCDFASQPDRPVSPEQATIFRDRLLGDDHAEADRGRCEALLPLYRLKWCCILLNEFRAPDRQRRAHAGHQTCDQLQVQLAKAQDYFTQHLGSD